MWGIEASCPIFPSSLPSLTFWDETKLEQRGTSIKGLNCIWDLCQKCFSPQVICSVLALFVFTSKLQWKWKDRKWHLGLQIAVVTFLWLDLALLKGVFPLKVRSCLHIMRKYLASELVKDTTDLLCHGIISVFLWYTSLQINVNQ